MAESEEELKHQESEKAGLEMWVLRAEKGFKVAIPNTLDYSLDNMFPYLFQVESLYLRRSHSEQKFLSWLLNTLKGTPQY